MKKKIVTMAIVLAAFISSCTGAFAFSPDAWERASSITGSTSLTIISPTFHTIDSTAGSVTITLPPSAECKGKPFFFKKIAGSNSVTISRAGGDTIDSSTSFAFSSSIQGQVLGVESDGSTVWRVLLNSAPPNGGTSGQVETANGAGTLKTWTTPSSGGVTTFPSSLLSVSGSTASFATSQSFTANTALLTDGSGNVGFSQINLSNTSLLSSNLPLSKGGTGRGSWLVNGIPYYDSGTSTTQFQVLSHPGSADQILGTTSGGGYQWYNGLNNALIAGNGSRSNGILCITSGTTLASRTLTTGNSAQIVIGNGNGVSGDPTVRLADNTVFDGTEGVRVPSGTTAQRPSSSTDGYIRYNSDLNRVEVCALNVWYSLGYGITTNPASASADERFIRKIPFGGWAESSYALPGSIGTNNYYMASNGSDVVFRQLNMGDAGAGTLSTSRGGTGNGSLSVTNLSVCYTDGSKIVSASPAFSSNAVFAGDCTWKNILTMFSDQMSNTVGFPAITTSSGIQSRAILGTTNQIGVTAGDGDVGNPTIALANNLFMPGTAGCQPPSGSTAQRGSTEGQIRYNTDDDTLEYRNATTWIQLGNVTLPSNVAYTDAANNYTASQLPNAVNLYDLGSATKWWRKLYLGDNASFYSVLDTQNLTGNRTVTIPDADSTTVQPDAGASNNFLTAISSTGVVSKAQPSSSNLSDGSSLAKINAGNSWSVAQVPSAAGTVDIGSTTLPFRDLYLRGAGANYARFLTTSLNGNRTVNIPNADSTTVQADTGATNNFVTAISAQGVISKAQPSFANLSGAATSGQLPSNVAYNDASNSWTVNQVPNANTVDLGQDGTTWRSAYLGNSGTSTHRILPTTPTADRTHNLPNADSTTVQPDTGAANNWISAISAQGVITKSQPASSNLSDGANLAKINAGNSWSAAQVPSANTVNLGQDGTTWNDIYLKNSGTSTHKITATTATADRTHTLPNADSTTVVPSSGSAGQFATGISSGGVISYASPSGFAQFGGDGSDGAVSVTTNSAASQAKMQRNCSSYSLSGANIGDTLYSGSIINSSGTVSITCTGTSGGIICQTGPDGGSAGTPSSNAGNGSGIYGGSGGAINISAGGAGGSSAFATGGAGGAGAGGVGGTFPQATMSGARLVEGGGGGGGGSANTSSIAGPGGDGGGVFIIAAVGAITISPSSAGRVEMLAGSAGVSGSGSGTGAGGGAGGGAGVGFHYSKTSITQGANATVNYSGGTGGNGGANNAGGAGGGAGSAPVYVSPSNSIAGTVTVSGGAAGTKVGTGVNGTAGSNGPSGGVSITATPNLPLISLHMDFRGLKNQILIADTMEKLKGVHRSGPLQLDGRDHTSFLAAIYAAPGKDADMRFCLNNDCDYDPRSLCDSSIFGNNLEKAHPLMRKFLNGHVMPEAKPVCLRDALLDNQT